MFEFFFLWLMPKKVILILFSFLFREDGYPVHMQYTATPSEYQHEGYNKAMPTLIDNKLTKFPEPQR